MNTLANSNLTSFAKELRKNMTRQERHLWYGFLKHLPITVHRQKVIGSYIVDFYIAEKKLVIELDGSQHYAVPGKQADGVRDAFLRKQGITVVRYANSDVDGNFGGVCADITARLDA